MKKEIQKETSGFLILARKISCRKAALKRELIKARILSIKIMVFALLGESKEKLSIVSVKEREYEEKGGNDETYRRPY